VVATDAAVESAWIYDELNYARDQGRSVIAATTTRSGPAEFPISFAVEFPSDGATDEAYAAALDELQSRIMAAVPVPETGAVISIRSVDDTLRFVVEESGVRIDAVSGRGLAQLLDRLLVESTDRPQADLGNTLFELLLPDTVKDVWEKTPAVHLVLDAASARYPWEILNPRSSDKPPLAVRGGMMRTLVGFRTSPHVHARTLTALVIGDPGSAPNLRFPRLPGAAEEARRVAAALAESDYKVKILIQASALEILRALSEDEYQILHIAGHGVTNYEANGAYVTGVVLGDGMYLTAAELQQMHRPPEFVFLNCAHLEMVQPTQPGKPSSLVTSIAESIVRLGVEVFIGAALSIADRSAVEFVMALYDRLCAGATLGEAIRNARYKSYLSAAEAMAWGSYHCYGTPQYRLFDLPITQHAAVPDEWITIPAGEFRMGATADDDPEARDDESPVHTVYLDTYQMARYPVTIAEYRRFVESKDYKRPADWDKQVRDPKRPVVNVTWHDAAAYCAWAGVRLPTEAEWERAARGTSGRKYPWGNEKPDISRANYGKPLSERPTAVGLYPQGATPEGIEDMAGNVWEWVADWDGPYGKAMERNPRGPINGTRRVQRGGSCFDMEVTLRGTHRRRSAPELTSEFIGFRCVRELIS
jgi:formylglycine-generating enzyme required for sulfatase activity